MSTCLSGTRIWDLTLPAPEVLWKMTMKEHLGAGAPSLRWISRRAMKFRTKFSFAPSPKVTRKMPTPESFLFLLFAVCIFAFRLPMFRVYFLPTQEVKEPLMGIMVISTHTPKLCPGTFWMANSVTYYYSPFGVTPALKVASSKL